MFDCNEFNSGNYIRANLVFNQSYTQDIPMILIEGICYDENRNRSKYKCHQHFYDKIKIHVYLDEPLNILMVIDRVKLFLN